MDQLETEALKLDPELRFRLAERLFLSLDPFTDEDWQDIWSAEGNHRNAEMTADPGLGVSADDVFRKAYSKLK